MSDAYYYPGAAEFNPWFRHYGRHKIKSQYVLTVPPAIEPVSIPQAKQWAVIEHSQDDAIIGGLITAARMDVENWLSRAFITQTWVLYMDNFYWEYELRKPPVQSVTSIMYIDVNGITQALDPSIYAVDNLTEPTRIRPAWNMVWPVTRTFIENPIWTTFICGYGSTAASVPYPIQQAICELVTFRYRNREPLSLGPDPAKVEDNIRCRVMSQSWGSYV
jgi:uncharacterized phiE125 gp8 family phage protein